MTHQKGCCLSRLSPDTVEQAIDVIDAEIDIRLEIIGGIADAAGEEYRTDFEGLLADTGLHGNEIAVLRQLKKVLEGK